MCIIDSYFMYKLAIYTNYTIRSSYNCSQNVATIFYSPHLSVNRFPIQNKSHLVAYMAPFIILLHFPISKALPALSSYLLPWEASSLPAIRMLWIGLFCIYLLLTKPIIFDQKLNYLIFKTSSKHLFDVLEFLYSFCHHIIL